ncbi:MAG: hypothetical protein KAI47_01315 [Deltaproteobacteria bacterium]|nr:hypothetical protein [Deltaproteobacteria bacterium]
MMSSAQTRSRRFEFQSKQTRNAFLRDNKLCIAGSLNRWPNVLNDVGEFVGDAYQLQDGRQQIEIWEEFFDALVDHGAVIPANDTAPAIEVSRRSRPAS